MTLPQFLAKRGLDPSRAMDLLQSEGLVSDECVWPCDVAPSDQAAAILWLTKTLKQKPARAGDMTK